MIVIRSEHTDPAGLDGQRFRPIFDPTPHRNEGMRRIDEEITGVPDDLLISTLVAYGMPRHAAEQLRHQPTLRFRGAHFWCLVQDANEGDGQAKEVIDYMRDCWQTMRRMEMIDERPEHTIGIYDR